MGFFDVECHRCGERFPADHNATKGTAPKSGHVKDIQAGVFKQAWCCPKCWAESLSAGFDLTNQDDVARWKATDWVATRHARSQQQKDKDLELKERLANVKVTTGDVKWEYEIDRVIFNIGANIGIWGGFIPPSPEAAFRHAEMALKVQAVELNCDAVIHTQFEHRIVVDKGVFGPNQGIEVFAYGTAVRRVPADNQPK